MAKTGLRVVSRDRQDRLTDEQTVRLGRCLVGLLGVDHVSYPDGEPTVVIQIWGYDGTLPPDAVTAIEAVIGSFEVTGSES